MESNLTLKKDELGIFVERYTDLTRHTNRETDIKVDGLDTNPNLFVVYATGLMLDGPAKSTFYKPLAMDSQFSGDTILNIARTYIKDLAQRAEMKCWDATGETLVDLLEDS